MRMKDRPPQFLKMNAVREENPPVREVGCPEYRRCLNEAAYNNFCLDCSQCAANQPAPVQTLPAGSMGSLPALACRG
jgi:hypothetical protein